MFKRALAYGFVAVALAVMPLGTVIPAQAANGNGPGGPLYPSTPLFSDNFSSGVMAPFVANNGLAAGGSWSVTAGALVANDYGSSSPIQNQLASVPKMRENVVLDTSFTINQVNPGSYYRIGLFGRGSAPHTGSSQWDLVLDNGNLELINQYVSYPAVIAYPIQPGQSYNMQMVIDGTWVGGRIWAAGSTEPSGWTITGEFKNTGPFTTVGVAAGKADVTFHSFAVYPAPPSLTLTPAEANGVFTGPGTHSYSATLTANDPTETGLYYVNYLVENRTGQTVGQGQVPVDLPAGSGSTAAGTATATVNLPRLSNGYYVTTFSLTNQSTGLTYQDQYPGHSNPPPGLKGGGHHAGLNGPGSPPPGHSLNQIPGYAQETPATAPVENTTNQIVQVPEPQDLSTVDSASPFGINGPGNRLGVITPAKEQGLVNDYTLFKEQGVQWVRTEFMWNYVEPKPGVYTWNQDDGLVEAGHTAHENLLGLLDYWGTYANPFGAKPQASFSTAVQEYDQYVAAVVKRYMPGGTLAQQMGWQHYGITAWEVWNEPSTRAFWLSQNPAQYAELVKSAAATIKAIEPNATILMYHWHQNTELRVAGTNSFTGLSIHDYPGPVRPSEAEFYGGVASLRSFLTQNGIGSDPIWMTESGFSSNSITLTQQAEYVVRAEIQSLAGSLNKFFMFSWNYPGSGFGELNGQLEPKPVFAAMAGLNSMLQGFNPATGVNPIEMGSGIRAFAFQNGSTSLVALWSNVGDGTITLPRGPVRAYNWMANPIRAQRGRLTLPLTGRPLYLVADMSPGSLARIVQKGTIQGIDPVAIAIQNLPNSPTSLPALSLTLTDQINVPESGTLQVTLPPGWEASTSSTTAATYSPSVSFGPLNPSQSTSESFTLSRFEANSSNQYLITATATVPAPASSDPGGPPAQRGPNDPGPGPHQSSGATSGTVTVSSSLPVAAFETVYGHPALTGSFQDWSNATPLQVNLASQNVGIPNWSPSLESATAYTMWNHHDFYFAAKVTDSVFNEPYTGFNQWQGDSLQLFWDPQNAKTTTYDAAYGQADFGIAKTPAGNQAYEFQGPAPGLHSDVTMRIVPGPSGGDMWYEVAIPLTDLPALAAAAGHPYGFDFLVNDNNGAGRLGWIWLTPGVGNGFDPADWPTFTLVNSAGLAAGRINAANPSQSLTFTPNSEGAFLSVDNSGVGTITVTAPNRETLTLEASTTASANVTPSGTNPTVPILQNGTTTINLANYLNGSGSQSLSASASPLNASSAIIAVNNGVNP